MTVSTDTWQPLGKLNDIEAGDKKEVALPNGKLVLIIRSDSGLYACCADCPHQDTPLAEGSLDGNILMCPLHFWQWNIATGEKVGLAEVSLETFELRQENNEWFIRA